MKIGGKKPGRPAPELAVIPRSDGDLVFKCAAVTDYTEFEQRCPEPKAPFVQRREGPSGLDYSDAQYQEKLKLHSRQMSAWVVLKSLEDTPDLVWEKVQMDQPDTWLYFEEEMIESGLTKAEVNYIVNQVMIANSMDEKKMKEARDRFIQSQAEQPSQ